jgi:hypothetical protein
LRPNRNWIVAATAAVASDMWRTFSRARGGFSLLGAIRATLRAPWSLPVATDFTAAKLSPRLVLRYGGYTLSGIMQPPVYATKVNMA